jgi:predicted RNA-binding protein with PIN domain
MTYYIDGYNLLFRLVDSRISLQKQRLSIIRFLQKQFVHFKNKGLLIFDGAHRSDEESGRSYPSPLEVVYTPRGQSADAYILEKLESIKKTSSITVVSDDNHLTRSARALGAHAQSNVAFLNFLEKKRSQRTEKKIKEPVDSKQNIDRLLKIFEKRLKDPDD